MMMCPPETTMPSASHPEDPSIDVEAAAEALEQQMAELGLSGGDKRFLRNFHRVEKQLNDAIEEARQCDDLEQRVSQVYRQMYGTD